MKHRHVLKTMSAGILASVITPVLAHVPESAPPGSLHDSLHHIYGHDHTLVISLMLGGFALGLTVLAVKQLLKRRSIR